VESIGSLANSNNGVFTIYIYIYIYIYRYIHGHTYMDILDMMHGRTTTFKSLLIRDLHSILYLHMCLKILINNTLKGMEKLLLTSLTLFIFIVLIYIL